MTATRAELPTSSVLTVGLGRGFVIEHEGAGGRFVITAAHCLPFFPPCASASGYEGRTYQALLAPLGAEPTAWAECRFVDPIADIAVLGTPDDQALAAESVVYTSLVNAATLLPIAPARSKSRAWLLSLDQTWRPCAIEHFNGPLWITQATGGIAGGMSGSPIIANGGVAIGVVSCSSGYEGEDKPHTDGGPNPNLTLHLPSWLLRKNARRTAPRFRNEMP
jgi:hypothetical protein